MKAHSVKSNAKRAARKFAERFPAVTVETPEAASAGGWLPVVMIDEADLTAALDNEAEEAGVIVIRARDAATDGIVLEQADMLDGNVSQTVRLADGAEVERVVSSDEAYGPEDPAEQGEASTFEADVELPQFLPSRREISRTVIHCTGGQGADRKSDGYHDMVTANLDAPTKPTKPKPADTPRPPKPLAADEVAKIAASLPPRKDSTPEEIAARRAERRQRVAEEKAAGVRDKNGNKLKTTREPRQPQRADIIVELVSRDGGATVEELTTATGWQRHTLRGYIAGTLRKRGHAIEVRKKLGEPTRYVMGGVA